MTLYSLVKAIKGLAKLQPNISFVHSGDVYELNKSGEVDYPAFVISQNTHREDMMEDTEVYGFNLFAVDRLTSDAKNQLDIQSWANDLLKNIIEQIEELNLGIVVGEVIIQPFTERFESLCAGCYAQIQISIDNIDCDGDKYLLRILDKINNVKIFKDVYELEGTKPGSLLLYDGDKPIHFGEDDGYFCVELIDGGTIDIDNMDKFIEANVEFMVEGDEGFQSIEHITSYVFTEPKKVYFKGYLNISLYDYVLPRFIITDKANLSGNIMSLVYGDEYLGKTSMFGKSLYRLFLRCYGIQDASKLKLPAVLLGDYCYQGLFMDCTSLVEAPELPAVGLARNCYAHMFNGCSSLVEAPELPARTLEVSCYWYMFNRCTSLTKAPELSATSLASDCYANMFNSCHSLVEAPELPAIQMVSHCYESMFSNCTSLTKAPKLRNLVFRNAYNCFRYMFGSCTSLVDASEILPNEYYGLEYGCYMTMFSGCTSLTKAPKLPALVLKDYCYQGMFSGCTSLVEAPELPATTLANGCYENMFGLCSKLNKVKCNARYYYDGETEIQDWIQFHWLDYVAPNGTFYKNPEWSGPTARSPHSIPPTWTIVDWIQ